MSTARHFCSAILAAAVALAMAGTPASAEEVIVNDAPRPHVTVPLAKVAPLITAQADDPAWDQAVRVPLVTPSLGTAQPLPIPIPQTEVRLLWDADWLYLRFLCHDDHIYLPVHGPNAPVYRGDAVEFFIDPLGDGREWMEIEVNATNDVYNQITVCTAEPKWDRGLRLTSDFIAHDTWTFPNIYLKELRTAAAAWKTGGAPASWIVDLALPAAGVLKRSGEKKLHPMALRGNFLRYKSITQTTAVNRQLLSLTWSPVVLNIPHRCPAALGFLDLAAPSP